MEEHWQLKWQKVAFITLRLRPKWHRFQKNFRMFWFWSSLSAFCLGGLTLSVNKKRSCFSFTERFSNLCGSSSTPICIFKRSARRICQLQPFQIEIYLFFRHWNIKINAIKTVRIWTCGLCWLFWSQRRVLLSHNHSTQLSNCIESISWTMFTWRPWILKCLKIHNCIATRNWYHISPIWQVFSPGGEIVNWFDLRWRQNSATTVEHETEWSCYSLPIFFPCCILYSPQFRSNQETKMAAVGLNDRHLRSNGK